MVGATAKLEDFLNFTIMDNFKTEIMIIKNLNFTPIWLDETSTAVNGGAVNLSDTYAAGFLWLDKLGLAALYGLDVVVRQTFYGENYAMLDREMYPLPVNFKL